MSMPDTPIISEIDVDSRQDTSTLTMERVGDDLSDAMLESFERYFSKGGGNITSVQQLKEAWRIGKKHTGRDSNGSNNSDLGSDEEMPELDTAIRPVCDNEESDDTSTVDSEDKYDGKYDCGNCHFDYITDQSQTEESLRSTFGSGMICAGRNCRKTIYQCLKEAGTGCKGVHVCVNCKDDNCRKMKCNMCWYSGTENTVTRRSTKV